MNGTFNTWAQAVVDSGWAMLWQSSLLIAFLFALDLLLARKLRAAVRYALWLVVLVKLLLPPSLALPSGLAWWLRNPNPAPAPAQRNAVVITYGADRSYSPPVEVASAEAAVARAPISPAGWGIIVSGCVSLGLLVLMLNQWRQVIRVARAATPPPSWIERLLQEAALSAGWRRSVRMKVTDHEISPAVCGFFRPVILIPRALVERFSAAQLRAILLHELVHLRRGDVWLNCAQGLIQVVYWWHPLVWLANARIRRVREEAVDDAVMHSLQRAADTYAPTLLEVARLALQRPMISLGLVGILEPRSSLGKRIERLVNRPPLRNARLTAISLACVAAFGALALPMGQPPAPQRPVEAPSSTEPRDTPTAPDNDQQLRAATLAQTGKSLYEKGNVAEAEARLREAAQADPANAMARFYLSLIGRGPLRQEVRTITNANFKSRQAIVSKLDRIRIGGVEFENVPLSEVVRHLSVACRSSDPAGHGVNFLINPNVPSPQTNSATAEPQDLAAVAITVTPKLLDVRLADLLDAVVRSASKPIKYSIEDYAVVFSFKRSEPPPLYTRIIKFDPNTFLQSLEAVTGQSLAPAPPDPAPALQQAVREFFKSVGVSLDPPTTIFLKDREGSLMVRATLADLDAIENAVQLLNTTPPQINIRTKFYVVPDALADSLLGLARSISQPDTKASSFTRILTATQARGMIKSLETAADVELLHEASVTTLSGRQTQVQLGEIQSIVTNINPQALRPPGVSTNASGGSGVYAVAQVPLGPTLDLIPYASADERTIQLTAVASLTEFLGYGESTNRSTVFVDGESISVAVPQPRLKQTKATARAIVWDGQTLLFGNTTSESPSTATKPGSENRRLLALVTPVLIDPAGNRLHADDEAPEK